jgi:hypothetical protein
MYAVEAVRHKLRSRDLGDTKTTAPRISGATGSSQTRSHLLDNDQLVLGLSGNAQGLQNVHAALASSIVEYFMVMKFRDVLSVQFQLSK